MQSNAYRDKDRDTLHIHPSEMAKDKWCGRQTFYRISQIPPDSDKKAHFWRTANVFEEGHDIHEKYQGWLWEMGVLEGMWKCRVCDHRWWALSPAVCNHCGSVFIEYAEVPISLPDHLIIGHGDGIVTGFEDMGLPERVLLEIKSIGLGSVRYEVPGLYRTWKDNNESIEALWGRIKRPFPAHVRQVHTYMHDLMNRLDITTVMYIYEFKATQDFKVFTAKYNPKIAEPLLDKALKVRRARDSGKVPERPEWATDPKVEQCQECPYRGRCWGGQAGEEEE